MSTDQRQTPTPTDGDCLRSAPTVNVMRRAAIIKLIAGILITAGIVAALAVTTWRTPADQPTSTQPTLTPDQPTPGPSTTTEQPKPIAIADGIYEVGTEIPAGAYTTTVPTDAPHGCYWARLRNFNASGAIIAEDNLGLGEHARVVVNPGDRGFKVSNGCTWTWIVTVEP